MQKDVGFKIKPNSYDHIAIIAQGSQSVQLIRELFGLGINPDEILVLTVNDHSNNTFIEFLKFYKINYIIVNKLNFDNKIYNALTVFNKYRLVISFSNPFIINKNILDKSIFINFHPGILPYYKGSLSTVWSMINKEGNTGGTWHYISADVDKGNIIDSFKIPIRKDSTAFSLNHQVFSKGICIINKVLKNIKDGFSGDIQANQGQFYYNKFPNLNKLNLDAELIRRIEYFPPHHKTKL